MESRSRRSKRPRISRAPENYRLAEVRVCTESWRLTQQDEASRIISIRSPTRKGFRIKYSIVPPRDTAATSRLCALVTIAVMPGRRRLASTSTSPLVTPGKVTSRRSTSMWFLCARIQSNAADPSLASKTEKPFFRSILETAWRKDVSSSTTNTVASLDRNSGSSLCDIALCADWAGGSTHGNKS